MQAVGARGAWERGPGGAAGRSEQPCPRVPAAPGRRQLGASTLRDLSGEAPRAPCRCGPPQKGSTAPGPQETARPHTPGWQGTPPEEERAQPHGQGFANTAPHLLTCTHSAGLARCGVAFPLSPPSRRDPFAESAADTNAHFCKPKLYSFC